MWIRYTMLAPLHGAPTCSLWLAAMDPGRGAVTGRKSSYPASALTARADPFELRVHDSVLSDRGMSGALDGASWDLRWEPRLPASCLPSFLAFLQHGRTARAKTRGVWANG